MNETVAVRAKALKLIERSHSSRTHVADLHVAVVDLDAGFSRGCAEDAHGV